MAPRVPFVRDVPLQNSYSSRLARFGSVFNSASNRWGVGEANPFRQKASDFQIGIHAFFSPTEKLQYQLISENDGRVALLSSRRRHFKTCNWASSAISQRASRRGDEIPRQPAH